MSWIKQTSTWLGLGAAIVAAVTAIAPQWGALAASILSALGLIINDRNTPKRKKPGLGTGAVILLTPFVVLLGGCGGALEQFADTHQDDIADLEACGIQCGVDLAAEALACPIKGGSIEDLITNKGLAKDAAQCVLSCMTAKATDIFSEVCKDASGL